MSTRTQAAQATQTAQWARIATREVPVADYVPFSSHVEPGVIKLRDSGDYIAIWKLEGIPFETTEFDDLKTRTEAFNNFLRTLGGGQYALWSHKVRRRIRDRLPAKFPDEFCRRLDDAYHASFRNDEMMATELFLTVVYRPAPSRVANIFRRMTVRSLENIAAAQRRALDTLRDIARQLDSSLARYKPRRLGVIENKDKPGVAVSEMASFLGFLVNGHWEDIPLRRAGLADYLPSSRLFFGDRNGVMQIEHPAARKFAGFLEFQEYPAFSETGMNNAILYGNWEYVETQSFSMVNKREAVDWLERQRNQLMSGEEASVSEIADMDTAIDQLQGGLIELGEYHYTLAVFADSPERLGLNMAEARACFDGPGFRMAVNDVTPECAWFAQLPGNWTLRPREARITSYNFACLSPLHNFASGKRTGNPWGDAITLLKTPSGQPYYFNFHPSPDGQDVTDDKLPGNTTILGTTGAGKTVTLCFLLAQARKLNTRLVVFDKDRGMEIFIRAIGGHYRALRRGVATGINPFQWPDTARNRALCEQVVAQCVRIPQQELTARELADIRHAVATTFSLPLQKRRLAAVDQSLPGAGDNSLRLRLKKWIGNNPLGWVVDNPVDTLDLASHRVFGFDYTEFLDDAEVRPVLMLMLLHAVEGLIDGAPFIYVMEEFWKPLRDPIFADFALNKQKTIRKENGLGIFVTQSPSDVLDHPIAKTMVEQSVTLLCLPNPRADYHDYVEGFKFTAQEFEVIRNLPENGRLFLVKQGSRSAIVKLDLSGLQHELIVLSGSIDNVALLDAIRAQTSDDPAVWMPLLIQQVARRRRLAGEKSAHSQTDNTRHGTR